MKKVFQVFKKYSLAYICYRIFGAQQKAWEIFITNCSGFLFHTKCRLFGCKCGKNLYVYGRVILRPAFGAIEIGDNVTLVSSSWRCSGGALNHPVKFRTFSKEAKIFVGNGCSFNGTSVTCRSTAVRIGDETMIAPNVTIMDSDFHNPWPPERRLQYRGRELDAEVNIGKRVWIGSNSMIMKGVTIGDNSIIGCGSVVVKNVPANVLVAGNPAKILKEYDVNG